MEGAVKWHHGVTSPEEYQQALGQEALQHLTDCLNKLCKLTIEEKQSSDKKIIAHLNAYIEAYAHQNQSIGESKTILENSFNDKQLQQFNTLLDILLSEQAPKNSETP